MNSKHLNQKTVDAILAADGVSGEENVRTATASHQNEFPYDRENEAHVTRREFCNFLFLTSSAMFVASAGFAGKLAYESSQIVAHPPLKIDGAGELLPGNALNFRYPDEDTAILVRAADGKYYAYDQQCTHLTCPVYYSDANDRLECPCHEGGFDVHTGNVLYGPPPRPLDMIELDVRSNGEIWAVGKKIGGGHGTA